MALMAAIVVPNLGIFKKQQANNQFISSLNYVTQLAWDNGANTGFMQRVVFDFNDKKIKLEQDSGSGYKPLEKEFLDSQMPLGDIEIQNIYINGFDEFKLKTGELKKDTVWFYVVPNGLTQEVTINYDAGDKQKHLILDPFTAIFTGGDDYKSA